MKYFYLIILTAPFAFLLPASLFSQEGFGFGDSDLGFSDAPSSSGSASNLSVKISGEVKTELRFFINDFESTEDINKIEPGNIFSGSLNFEASNSLAQGIVKLNLIPVFDGKSSPVEIDEAYMRAFFGPVTIEGGIRKVTWGKADSFGPLDVINPLDYSDLSLFSDPQSVKIARPMLRAIWSLGSFSRLEGVFVPWFQGHKFTSTGRWAPSQINVLNTYGFSIDSILPQTNTFEYAQAGLRLTTSIGSSDVGFQYYSGIHPRPAVDVTLNIISLNPLFYNVNVNGNYNRYYQFAVDFARVVAGFNIRVEAGVNITDDFDGTNKSIENPAFIWSLGFDRDLFLGININLQGTGKVRFFHDKIGSDIIQDCEGGTDATSTRITGIISRKFLRDELEVKLTNLWGIEDKDFYIIPSVAWSRNDVKAELSMGFFGGDKSGELGQYRDNNFIRMMLSYSF